MSANHPNVNLLPPANRQRRAHLFLLRAVTGRYALAVVNRERPVFDPERAGRPY